jgi:phospholipid N-methyltransferase
MRHLAHLRTSGTVMPSSRYLVARLLKPVDFAGARRVVQLGVGTGTITRAILRRLAPAGRLLAVEINPVFAAEGRAIADARLRVVEGNARDLEATLAADGDGPADAIISALPLTLIAAPTVARILTAVQRSLAPRGIFVQYQYTLQHRDDLAARFRHVKVGFTLRNIPPAFVYECRAPWPVVR